MQPLLNTVLSRRQTPTESQQKKNPSTVTFIEGAWVVIPYSKGLSEKYRHIPAKYRVRDFFKGTSTIKYLFMHPKDPIPDSQKTDIIYPWKCPADNCTSEYISETNRSLKKEFQTTKIKPPVPSEITTSPQNTQIQNLKILQ